MSIAIVGCVAMRPGAREDSFKYHSQSISSIHRCLTTDLEAVVQKGRFHHAPMMNSALVKLPKPTCSVDHRLPLNGGLSSFFVATLRYPAMLPRPEEWKSQWSRHADRNAAKMLDG
jgi:hypothetical protein